MDEVVGDPCTVSTYAAGHVGALGGEHSAVAWLMLAAPVTSTVRPATAPVVMAHRP